MSPDQQVGVLTDVRNRLGHLMDGMEAIGVPDGRLVSSSRSVKQIEAALGEVYVQMDLLWGVLDDIIETIKPQP